MLTNALSAVGSRLDSKFIAAFWLPAFVGVLGFVGILVTLVGSEQFDYWRQSLDSVEQTLLVLFIVLVITMGAVFLRAMVRPIAEMFAGQALPGILARWSAEGQRQLMRGDLQNAKNGLPSRPSVFPIQAQRFPTQEKDVQPTLLGNVLASAAEHPRLAYAMEAMVWWPRLSPLLPDYFQATLNSVQSPLMAMLNLSVIFVLLALIGGAALALPGENWSAALLVFGGGLILAWLCYRAALRQATEFASMIRVGFDLYRHEILRQMDMDIPTDLAEEQALWLQLTTALQGGNPAASTANGDAAGDPEVEVEAPAENDTAAEKAPEASDAA